ncbi:rhodanese-like domain-containing protein [Methylocucumis oryzae]|uniref:Rhodanese domain-containing protein n=1 Tax=Methylocucumis oryzae TaxID=1632867 RepID=A0A0F3IHF8_9GAMM|nr:rhodanese-like domain-containing protein [Methylocucumis oryzae]KJV06112.1 hypothetical protein VZ94_13445 [Methylocucumis oryzae]
MYITLFQRALKWLLSLVLLLPLTSHAEENSINAEQAAMLSKDKQAVIIDVREQNEWQQSHIPNAIHIPLNELPQRLSELNRFKSSTIITQCRSGKRSAQAQSVLKNAGFTTVLNLTGGLNAWQSAGLPTE